MKEKYFIIVDMQNDFIDGTLGTKEAQAIVENVAKKIKEMAAAGYYIICTRDTHADYDYLDTMEGKNLPVKHCIKETTGWELHPFIREALLEVVKRENEYLHMVDKTTFGVPRWEKILGEEWDVDEIVLCGLCTDICVVTNALLLKTAYPEVKISVLSDLCAGVTPESHEQALATMRMCQVNVL